MYERCKNDLLVVSDLSITTELYVQFYVIAKFWLSKKCQHEHVPPWHGISIIYGLRCSLLLNLTNNHISLKLCLYK